MEHDRLSTSKKACQPRSPDAERLAISRVRLDGANKIEREHLTMPPDGKIAPTEHVGCMAVLGRTGLNATNERRTI